MRNNNYSARQIAKNLGICHRTVLQVRRRKNFEHTRWKKGRSCLLSERDARAKEILLTSKQVEIPKQAAAAIGKTVSEWTARRALRRIGLISAVNQKNQRCQRKMFSLVLNFARNTKIEVPMTDETKINRFQCYGKEYYWHSPYERLKNTK